MADLIIDPEMLTRSTNWRVILENLSRLELYVFESLEALDALFQIAFTNHVKTFHAYREMANSYFFTCFYCLDILL